MYILHMILLMIITRILSRSCMSAQNSTWSQICRRNFELR
jgi:hypothetical protein